jgi:hypothetical protein
MAGEDVTDTPRTVAELKTIFADNSSGDISAQDMRDLVVTVAPFRGLLLTFADLSNATYSSEALTGMEWLSSTIDTEGFTIPFPSFPDSLEIPVDGMWRIDASCRWDNNATGYRELQVKVTNPDTTLITASAPGFASQDTGLSVSVPAMPMEAGALCFVFPKQSSGGDLDLHECLVGLQRVGDIPA